MKFRPKKFNSVYKELSTHELQRYERENFAATEIREIEFGISKAILAVEASIFPAAMIIFIIVSFFYRIKDFWVIAIMLLLGALWVGYSVWKKYITNKDRYTFSASGIHYDGRMIRWEEIKKIERVIRMIKYARSRRTRECLRITSEKGDSIIIDLTELDLSIRVIKEVLLANWTLATSISDKDN